MKKRLLPYRFSLLQYLASAFWDIKRDACNIELLESRQSTGGIRYIILNEQSVEWNLML